MQNILSRPWNKVVKQKDIEFISLEIMLQYLIMLAVKGLLFLSLTFVSLIILSLKAHWLDWMLRQIKNL